MSDFGTYNVNEGASKRSGIEPPPKKAKKRKPNKNSVKAAIKRGSK